MKTKHVIFGVLYAVSTAYFIFVGDLIASILMLIILLCMIALSIMKKNLEVSKLNFEKTLSHRKKAFDEMFETNMQLMEDLRAIRVELKQKDAEIAELKPLAQQRLDYLHHERDRKKSYRKENSDLLRVRRFAKKHAGRVVVRKDGFDLNSSGEDTAMICGYDKDVAVLIISSTKGWTKIDECDVVLKESGTGYDYISLTSIKLVKHETKN